MVNSTCSPSTLKTIHDSIFLYINQSIVNVFLCGAASNSKQISVRDKVRNGLKANQYLRVLYPEDLFIEMLNKDKASNLLSLEEFLAQNCDIICIICESPGSLVELGAFTNNDKTFSKVVAVINKKYEKQKSFIMLGPIKLIRANSRENVLFYSDDNVSELVSELNKYFNNKRTKKISKYRNKASYTISTLIGMYYFIPMVIYFYNNINIVTLEKSIQSLYEDLSYSKVDYDKNYKSAIKLLHKEKLIKKSVIDVETHYALTEKGYEFINEILNRARIENKDNLYNKIRLDIISKRYY